MKRILPYTIIFLLLFSSFTPLIFVLTTSFKSDNEIYFGTSYLFIESPTFKNYLKISDNAAFLMYFRNSFIASIFGTFFTLLLGIPCGYALSKMDIKFSPGFLLLLLLARILPPVSLLWPLFNIASKLNLLDSISFITLGNIYLNLPFVVWLLRDHYRIIPNEVIDAAKLDGFNEIGLLLRIIIPISLPGIFSSSILTFIFSWNEFLIPLVIGFTEHSKTVPVGIFDFVGDFYVNWGQLCAAVSLSLVPPVIFVVLFQKFIVQGILSGKVDQNVQH
jgi:multiple sugar transport system permease protein